MIDCRYQESDKVNELAEGLSKIVSQKIKVSIAPYTTNKAGELYTYGVRVIDEQIQDSVYKRMIYKKFCILQAIFLKL